MYQGTDRLISYFLVVAEEGNISSAARVLNLTQPALTRSIRLLEEHLGVELFERHANGVSLTVGGQLLARRARFMRQEFEHAKAEIGAFKGGWKGEINIGVVSAWGLIFLPEIVAKFRERIAHVKINIVRDFPRQLMAQLVDGELDLICGGLGFPEMPGIVKEPLFEMERVVVAAANHPLAKKRLVEPARLLEYPWAGTTGAKIASMRLATYFSAFGLPSPEVMINCNSLDVFFAIIRITDAVGTASQPILQHSIASGLTILPIRGSLWKYETGLLYRHSPNPPGILTGMLSCIREYCASLKGAEQK